MDSLPRRQSLPDQVTQLLRENIAAGRWSNTLPSESDMVREFKVSRVTLRKALDQLTHEKWIGSAGRGRHHPILRPGHERALPAKRVVRILSPMPLDAMPMVTQIVWNALREELSSAGQHIRLEIHPELFKHPRAQDLQRLIDQPDAAAWVLYRSPAEMQQWFSRQETICLVAGCLHAANSLTNIEFDYVSIARHAAGLFYQRRHRHMAYLCSEPLNISDLAGGRCFVEEARRLGADARIISCAPNLPDIRRALDHALAARPQPTAFYIAWPEHAVTALTYFQQAKLRVPQDVAIISRMNDNHLHFTLPTIAHYHMDGARYGRKAAQILLDLLEHGHGKRIHVKITPRFIPGDSL